MDKLLGLRVAQSHDLGPVSWFLSIWSWQYPLVWFISCRFMKDHESNSLLTMTVRKPQDAYCIWWKVLTWRILWLFFFFSYRRVSTKEGTNIKHYCQWSVLLRTTAIHPERKIAFFICNSKKETVLLLGWPEKNSNICIQAVSFISGPKPMVL